MLENFLKKLRINKNTRTTTTTGDWSSSNPVVINGASAPNYYDDSMFRNISTVYICAKILANTLSRLPINVYTSANRFKAIDEKDPRYFLLHHEPNDIFDSYHFWNYLELQRNLTGNSFALIHRQFGGMPTSLEIIPNSWVTGYKQIDNKLFYAINYNFTQGLTVESKDLLHFRDITTDGIWGISPVQILKMNASVSYKALASVDNLYNNDARSTKVLKPSATNTGVGDKAKYEELIKKVKENVSGYDKAGDWIVIPSNMDLQEVQMNINDALFLATVKFSAGQIASFYGVPPNLVGIFEQSKFNDVEKMQLGFITDAFAAIARMYRKELEKKLLYKDEILGGKSIEFNLRAMVETDHKTRTDILLNEVKGGVRTINEYRREEDLPSVEGGDTLLTFNQNTPISQMNQSA